MPIDVVGLGPGPADWVSPAATSTLRRPGARVLVRTALHPAVAVLLADTPYESLDALYEQAPSLEALHAAVVARLVDAAAAAEVVYAVPGDGTLGEAAVEALRERGLAVRVVPGVAEGSAALAAAGLPGADGLQAVPAAALGGSGVDLQVEPNPRWPAVVTGVYSRGVAGDVKLALQRIYPAEHEVRVVRHVGLADEAVVDLSLSRLDRGQVEFDHLTHVVVPAVALATPTGSSHGLRAIVARLRAPEVGCPWDLEQTHRSLIPYALEEAYEVVDAIESGGSAALMEELGDLLLQVALHAEIADQEGDFDLNDVLRTLSAKLIHRHPHVFGEVQVASAADVMRNWDVLKAQERKGEPAPTSALEGVPGSLPALKRAAELGRKAARAGFDWPARAGAVDKVREELDELLAATSLAERREEYGDLLWILANLAMRDGVDPEEAVRAANRKFGARFRALEQIARERGWEGFAGRSIDELLGAWAEARHATASRPSAAAEPPA